MSAKPLAPLEWASGEAPSWLLPPTSTSISDSHRRRRVYLDWLDFLHLRDRAAYVRWLCCEGYFK